MEVRWELRNTRMGRGMVSLEDNETEWWRTCTIRCGFLAVRTPLKAGAQLREITSKSVQSH